jgi:hypothetical protein
MLREKIREMTTWAARDANESRAPGGAPLFTGYDPELAEAVETEVPVSACTWNKCRPAVSYRA